MMSLLQTRSGAAGVELRACAATSRALHWLVFKLKSPWRDGTTHLVMSPLEFMQRLAALVPRPRLHMIRFHGVLAPNAKLRAPVVPQMLQPPAECQASCTHHRLVRPSWARLLKRVFALYLEHCANPSFSDFCG